MKVEWFVVNLDCTKWKTFSWFHWIASLTFHLFVIMYKNDLTGIHFSWLFFLAVKCASMKLCAVYMPRVDLWAIQSAWKDIEASSSSGPSVESSLTPTQSGLEECSKSESARAAALQSEPRNVSQTWKSFVEQLECVCASTSLIILVCSLFFCCVFQSYRINLFFYITMSFQQIDSVRCL